MDGLITCSEVHPGNGHVYFFGSIIFWGEDLLIQGRPLLKTELKGSSCCEDNRTVQTYEH